jgi:Uma2 family endonuclease
MTTATQLANKPEIEYPDDDGEPMSDNPLQYKWIVLIKENLEIAFRDDPSVFVAGNLLWYPVEGQPTIRNAPDAMVVFGRAKGRRGSYKQWEEGGVAPQVVFETLSPGNRAPEMARKLEFYDQYGVEEYYIYDPDEGSLVGWLREGRELVKVNNMSGFISPRLRIKFEPRHGPDNLTIWGPDGEPFRTSQEHVDLRKAAEKRAQDVDELFAIERQRGDIERERAGIERLRAECERQRADTERERADTEHERAEIERRRADDASRLAEIERQRAQDSALRADALAAKLRELGIDADSE